MRVDFCLFAAAPDIRARGFMVPVLTGSPEQLAQQSLNLGYQGIEYMPNPENVPHADDFRRVLEKSGALLPVVNSGRMFKQGLTLFHQDELVAKRAKVAFCEMLQFAGGLGASVGLGIARGPARDDLDREDMECVAEDLLNELAEVADREGAVILLEPAETNVTRFAPTVADVMYWVNRIDNPALGVMLDTHQLVENEMSLIDGIHAASGQASHIHLFDTQRFAPGTHPAGLDWQHLFTMLEHEGFEGTASVTLPDESTKRTAVDVAQFLNRVSNRTLAPDCPQSHRPLKTKLVKEGPHKS